MDAYTAPTAVEDVRALQRARRRDRMAMEVAQMGTWTRDMRTKVVEWSPELVAIFGLTEETYPRTHEAFFELVHRPQSAGRAGARAS